MARIKDIFRLVQLCSAILMIQLKQPEVFGSEYIKRDTVKSTVPTRGNRNTNPAKRQDVSTPKSNNLKAATYSTMKTTATKTKVPPGMSTKVYESPGMKDLMPYEHTTYQTATEQSMMSDIQTDFHGPLGTTTVSVKTEADANTFSPSEHKLVKPDLPSMSPGVLRNKQNFLRRTDVADSFRDKIREHIDLLCPIGQVCREKPTEELPPNSTPCCKECSCEPDCGKNCCFTGDAKNVSEIYFGKDCLHLTTNEMPLKYRHRYIAYEMESKCPPADVYNIDYNLEDDNCGEQNVALWGSYYPVYSQFAGKIFKNSACAECNDADDAVHFDALLVCDMHELNGYGEMRIKDVANMDSFFQGKENSCYINFVPKVPFSLLKTHECMLEPVTTCSPDDFDVPAGIDMSKEEIARACNSDFRSAYIQKGAYANVFCHICNGVKNMATLCEASETYYRDSRNTKFVSLLDPFYLESMRNERGASGDTAKKACLQRQGSAEDCRVIFCPAGRIHDKNGNCVFPTTEWHVSEYKVTLMLTPTQPIPTEYIDDAPGTFDISKLKLPFKNRWSVRLLGHNRVGNASVVEYFIAAVRMTNPYQNQSRMLYETEKHLKMNWFLDTIDKCFELHANFSDFKHIDVLDNQYTKPDLYPYNEDESKDFDIKWSLMYELILFEQQPFSITLTGMFYCYQIELLPQEFKLSHGDFVLYYKKTDKYFNDGQFVLVSRPNSRKRHARICIENTEYIRQNAALAILTKPNQLPVTLLFVLAHLLTSNISG